MPDEVLEYTIRMNDEAARPTARLRQATRGLEQDLRRAAITGAGPMRRQLRGMATDMHAVEARMNLFRRGGMAMVGTAGAITVGLADSTRRAVAFGDAMREVNTMVNAPSLDKLGDSLLGVTKDRAITAMPMELSEGLYKVGSGGRAAAEGQQLALQAGARLAEAGRAQMGPTLAGLLKLIRAYRWLKSCLMRSNTFV